MLQKNKHDLNIAERWKTVCTLSATAPFLSVGCERNTAEFEVTPSVARNRIAV